MQRCAGGGCTEVIYHVEFNPIINHLTLLLDRAKRKNGGRSVDFDKRIKGKQQCRALARRRSWTKSGNNWAENRTAIPYTVTALSPQIMKFSHNRIASIYIRITNRVAGSTLTCLKPY